MSDTGRPSEILIQFHVAARALCARGTTTHLSTKDSKKSYARVAPLVLPQAVLPKSCELKLDGITVTRKTRDDSSPKKRTGPIPLRATAHQKAIIKAKAAAAGVSVSGFCLASALGSNYKPTPRDPELTRALLMVNRELTAQGSNLNQITRKVNAEIITPTEGVALLQILARSLLRTHKAIRQVLGQGEPEP